MKNGCLVAFLVIIGGFLLFGLFAAQQADSPVNRAQANTVTLRAAPGNTVVQIFDSTGAQAAVIRQLPNGTTCSKISGPTAVNVEGISMSFYKLSCADVAGYVNAKWVR